MPGTLSTLAGGQQGTSVSAAGNQNFFKMDKVNDWNFVCGEPNQTPELWLREGNTILWRARQEELDRIDDMPHPEIAQYYTDEWLKAWAESMFQEINKLDAMKCPPVRARQWRNIKIVAQDIQDEAIRAIGRGDWELVANKESGPVKVRGGRNIGSNFYNGVLFDHGIILPTGEHWYQCRKADHVGDYEAFDKILRKETPQEAKTAGGSIDTAHRGWESYRVTVMDVLMQIKLDQTRGFRKFLISTGSRYIQHPVRDAFWGSLRFGNVVGQNQFGQSVMRTRDQVRGVGKRFTHNGDGGLYVMDPKIAKSVLPEARQEAARQGNMPDAQEKVSNAVTTEQVTKLKKQGKKGDESIPPRQGKKQHVSHMLQQMISGNQTPPPNQHKAMSWATANDTGYRPEYNATTTPPRETTNNARRWVAYTPQQHMTEQVNVAQVSPPSYSQVLQLSPQWEMSQQLTPYQVQNSEQDPASPTNSIRASSSPLFDSPPESPSNPYFVLDETQCEQPQRHAKSTVDPAPHRLTEANIALHNSRTINELDITRQSKEQRRPRSRSKQQVHKDKNNRGRSVIRRKEEHRRSRSGSRPVSRHDIRSERNSRNRTPPKQNMNGNKHRHRSRSPSRSKMTTSDMSAQRKTRIDTSNPPNTHGRQTSKRPQTSTSEQPKKRARKTDDGAAGKWVECSKCEKWDMCWGRYGSMTSQEWEDKEYFCAGCFREQLQLEQNQLQSELARQKELNQRLEQATRQLNERLNAIEKERHNTIRSDRVFREHEEEPTKSNGQRNGSHTTSRHNRETRPNEHTYANNQQYRQETKKTNKPLIQNGLVSVYGDSMVKYEKVQRALNACLPKRMVAEAHGESGWRIERIRPWAVRELKQMRKKPEFTIIDSFSSSDGHTNGYGHENVKRSMARNLENVAGDIS